jgi:WD40 repeat protein
MAAASEYDAFISYSHQHDALLGPALQTNLQRFAKPWYRMRALRIFVDAADLAANPALWASIEDGLRSAQWFILLASADAARSVWVDREVRWWVTNRSPDRLLVVGTGPGLAWNEQKQDWAADAPVPPALHGVFNAEPLWVDLSDVQLDDHRSVIPPDRVAAVAAPIRHMSKDMLVGEHLLVHRRAMRLAKGAIATLATLTALAVAATFVAIGQRNTAVTQSHMAQSEQLAAKATDFSATNAPFAMLLSVAAYERAHTAEARTALIRAGGQPLDLLLTAGTSAVTAAAYSTDGKDLATGEANGRIALWNTATWQQVRLSGMNGEITALVFSPGQQYLFAGDDAGDFGLWNTQTGKAQISRGKKGDSIQCLAVSPNGNFFAAGSSNGTVLLANEATGHNANLSEGYPIAQPVTSIAFSPDGRTLAVGNSTGGIQLWDTATGHRVKTLVTETESTGVASLAFSPDGKTLAVGGDSDLVRLWSISADSKIASLAEDSPVDSIAFSRAGTTLAAGTTDGTIGLWNVGSRTQTATFGEGSPVTTVAYSPDGNTLATADNSGHVGLWDTTLGNASTFSDGDGSPVTNVAFSPDEKTLAAGDLAGNVGLWDTSSRRRLIGFDEIMETYSTAFSPSGRTLAVGYLLGVDLWNVTVRQHPTLESAGQPTLVEGGDGSDSVAFSPDGTILAVGDYRGGVGLWDVASRHRLAAMNEGGSVNSVAFSPDGKILAVGDANGQITLWGVTSHSRIAILNEGSPVQSVAFSQDGHTLAAGDQAGHISLWQITSHQRIATLPDGSAVGAVTFSPGGQTLASGDTLGDVNTWDLSSHQRLATLAQTGTSISSLAFSRNGQEVAAGGYNGTVTLLAQRSSNLSQGSLTQLICGEVRENLTPTQWADNAPGIPYQKICPAYP